MACRALSRCGRRTKRRAASGGGGGPCTPPMAHHNDNLLRIAMPYNGFFYDGRCRVLTQEWDFALQLSPVVSVARFFRVPHAFSLPVIANLRSACMHTTSVLSYGPLVFVIFSKDGVC
jgi:hypothetical protein